MNSPTTPTVTRVLIANRGEIARRIIRTCRRLGIETVAVHSDVDADAPYVAEADARVHLRGATSAETYLRGDLLIAAAREMDCDAVHPGYGFLSENAAFAADVERSGLIWIGPPSTSIESMGSKTAAKALMRSAQVPVLPDNTVESLAEIGLPCLVKAAAGGGGRGMRIVRSADDLDAAIASAEREALTSFGDSTVFVERYVEGGRHVEIQVFADQHGNAVSLFERDCTLQRRHQKILEESPSPALDADLRSRMGEAAVAAARAVGYCGAGTVEFLLDRSGAFFFLEMNTRLQVEHPVTEMVTGLDLVELQVVVATGQPLPAAALNPTASGHAIEVRICAEDPVNGYLPSSGPLQMVSWPTRTGVRIDSGVETGSVVSPLYDSMIAKVIAHGPTRAAAARRLAEALTHTWLIGPTTNQSQLIHLLGVLESIDDVVDTTYLDRVPAEEPLITATEVAAVALAVRAERVQHRVALPHVVPGWRNNPSRLLTQTVGESIVGYRVGRSGEVVEINLDGERLTDDQRADAHRLSKVVCLIDGVAYLTGGRRVVVPPRYQPPDDAGRAGSTVAPMPGAVLRVFVAAGDHVVAGQALLAMEAMKMEHQVVSPVAGTVAEVFVAPGQQLDSGQVLVRVEPDE